MKVYRNGVTPPTDGQFGGTLGEMEIDLREHEGAEPPVIDDDVRAQLVKIGERLAEEATQWRTRGAAEPQYGDRVLGVRFHGITFSLILGPKGKPT